MNARALVAVASFLLLACQAKAGERCDGFFTNTCQSPSMCVSDGDKSFCAVSCKTHTDMERMGQKYCEDPSHALVEVEYDGPTGPVSMGCNCVPKE